jgi:hypothetical protein
MKLGSNNSYFSIIIKETSREYPVFPPQNIEILGLCIRRDLLFLVPYSSSSFFVPFSTSLLLPFSVSLKACDA